MKISSDPQVSELLLRLSESYQMVSVLLIFKRDRVVDLIDDLIRCPGSSLVVGLCWFFFFLPHKGMMQRIWLCLPPRPYARSQDTLSRIFKKTDDPFFFEV